MFMPVFLDFEASSLGKRSYPIEVAWVFEDGTSETHLIRPAPGWTDWDANAEALHGIGRETLLKIGMPPDVVARRMVDQLTGHQLFASAPSWDGKWLSTLLRAAGLPRHGLRLRGSEDAYRECATAVLKTVVRPDRLPEVVTDLIALVQVRANDASPVHRALPDAEQERARWRAAQSAAQEVAGRLVRP